ncbi:MAG: hypothetical protein ACLVHV_14335 [Oscillospiraceae bacterium]
MSRPGRWCCRAAAAFRCRASSGAASWPTPRGLRPGHMTTRSAAGCAYSELDCNGHLSNTKYLNWMEDLLPAQWHRNHMLSQVHVCYINEATDNQEITLNWTLEDGAMALEGRRDSEAAVQRVFALRALYRQLG